MLWFPRGVGGGVSLYREKEGGNCRDWSDFVSGEELLRSDYLGRTKCFCWWRVAVISGSWEIDGTHRAVAHWSQPRHWQSVAWLAMRENEAKWATCESISLSLLRVVDVTGVICINNLGSGMSNNHLFQSFSTVCMLYVWMHVCVLQVESFMLIRRFASFRFFSIPSLIPFKVTEKLWKRMKKINMNKSNTAYFAADFIAGKRERERKKERDSNHSNEGLSLLGPGVVCPGSLFLAPC